ncbi:MAG: hypothetical protein N4A72_03845 [Bacteroidales bacterium]|jgi:hypothetical protein|nr:hypothetical protein [Bacteroidales bacterium]
MKKNILLALVFCLLTFQFGCEKNSEIESAKEETQLDERDKLTSGERPKYKKGVTKPKVENSESYAPETRGSQSVFKDCGKYYEIIDYLYGVHQIVPKAGYYFFSFYIASSSDNSYQRVPYTDGYIPVDLNKDAGGNYMYLNFTLTDDKSYAITDIAVASYDYATNNTILPEQPTVYFSDNNYSFNKYHRDLNYDAGGKYVYLSFTRNSYNDIKLRSIAISYIYSYHNVTNSAFFKGYDWNPIDLNEDAGGNDIFLAKDRAVF